MRVAVVGHVEWAEFVRVERMPAAGDIVHAQERWEAAAGGGAVAAVRLAALADEVLFLTALGDDALGHRAAEALREHGVSVHAVFRAERQRRAFVHVDAAGERTITVIGRRLEPSREDPLPWERLVGCDAVYLTAGDVAAIRAARTARILVSTPRILPALHAAGVRLDALVGSARDRGERYEPGALAPEPALVVRTEGSEGGSWQVDDGRHGRWRAAPLPGPVSDSYGAGDTFAATLTYALACEPELDAALRVAARAGARAITERGPYPAPTPR